MKLITSSTPQIINERMMEATNTIIALLTSCVLVGKKPYRQARYKTPGYPQTVY